MSTTEAIENLYEVFKDYQSGNLEKCPCGCISDEEERKIYAKPLRQLIGDDLGYYNRKAITTWGEVEHYKHFLPRLFEIYSNKRSNSWIDLQEIYNKLEYGKWESWPENERTAIIEFIKSDWNDLINNHASDVGIFEFNSYSKYVDFDQLIEMWSVAENKLALKNFVHFFYYNANDLLVKNRLKVNGVDKRDIVLIRICNSKMVQILENEFFQVEAVDPEYAKKISDVIQMIEVEIKKNVANL